MISQKKNGTIHFFMTGGTIDSVYDGIRDTAVPRNSSIIPLYINSLRLYEKTCFTEICMKDSRALSKEDVKKLCSAIDKSESKKIIVTHGTYTMPDSARYLEANLKKKDKTIVLTGSMIPLEGFSPSDAGFALGYALSQVQILPKGVYVCMNGRTFSPREVLKVLQEGRFDSIFSKRN